MSTLTRRRRPRQGASPNFPTPGKQDQRTAPVCDEALERSVLGMFALSTSPRLRALRTLVLPADFVTVPDVVVLAVLRFDEAVGYHDDGTLDLTPLVVALDTAGVVRPSWWAGQLAEWGRDAWVTARDVERLRWLSRCRRVGLLGAHLVHAASTEDATEMVSIRDSLLAVFADLEGAAA